MTPQPQADRPFRTLEIEAVLGRNQRLVRLAVKKKPGVAANGRGQDGVPTYSLSAVQRNSAVATQSGEVTP
ncbi:MAG: hypothetical protein FJ267_08750 [Planctomycetes bacterium]|nr:hypothetical protein [Planctomycetota bacterium]